MDESEGQASDGEANEYVESGRPSETDGADDDDAAITSVDPPVKYHCSWEDWHQYFEGYCQRALQGRLLPLDDASGAAKPGADDDEGKTKAPSDEDSRDNNEEIPSTIIATLTS
ncbi:hypothetical protein GN958_ATG11833 [Phytophthora infestans]|uniref:Uncharacterized protein n=1 Tax=Phytophthora infestans TaxID=4787 RepID=A0A8S9UE56_PHYIN|nr:hypothetical protein GN958_ATG11833 [Phytophthora infestans]